LKRLRIFASHPTITKKKPAHYVNNQEFLAALKEFKAKTETREAGEGSLATHV
jgi:hypothetical protein